MKIKKGDIIVISMLLIFSLGFAFYISVFTSKVRGNTLIVEQDSKVIHTLPLDEDIEIKVDYNNHYNIIQIKDGKAMVSKADCRDQICTYMAPISDEGESIICLPNRLYLEVASTDDPTTEAIDKVVR